MMRGENSDLDAGGATTKRVAALDWLDVQTQLDRHGYAVLKALLDPASCIALAAAYDLSQGYRKHTLMAEKGYGRGEYKYWAYPLPEPIATLRTELYPHFAQTANRWNAALNMDARFPIRHEDYLARCHAAGQEQPTALSLKYLEGDFNCMHQDVYGDLVFPLQVTILLSRPGTDFTGGEFVLMEELPGMQPKAEVVPLGQGDAVVFAVRSRPYTESGKTHRVNLHHGVSRIRSGLRQTIGIIFHDAL